MRLIIGLGSGRCGTTSLSVLLDLQRDTSCTHEFCFLPWEFNQTLWDRAVGKLSSGKPPYNAEVIGDCGYYWINYVDRVLELFPAAKFICLWRDRQEVIDSTWEHSRGLNSHPNNPMNPYPYYATDRKTAIGLMWDEYTKLSKMWFKKHPGKFHLIEMNKALNDEYNQRKMLKFAGFERPRVRLNIRLNTNEKPVGDGE